MAENKDKNLDKSLRLLVKTSFVVFVGVVLSKILGYTYRIIIARYYGPEVYGLFSLALVISGWFIAISALGLGEGLLRFIPIYRGRKEYKKITYLFKISLIIISITSILSGVLLFLLSDFIAVSFFHDASLAIYLKIFSLIVPISVITSPFLTAIRAHEEIRLYSFIYNIAQNFAKVLILFILVFFGISNAVPLSYLAGLTVMLVASYAVCKYKIPHLFIKSNIKHDDKKILKREIMSYSIPILLFGIISIIFYWIDSFSLGYYKGVLEVGLYNAAVPLAVLLGVTPELFMQLFFPMITREYARKNIRLIEQLSKQVAKWILLVNLPIFAIMIVFPGALLNFFFGSAYLGAENALRILSIGALISSVFIVSSQLVSMLGKSKLILINIIIASIVNLLLNSWLVPMQSIGFIDNSSGLTGAALATLASVILFNALFMAQSYKYLSIIPLKKKMVNLFLIAIVPTALLFYLRTIYASNDIIVLAALFLIFIAVYAFLIWISKSLDENDSFVLKGIWNRLSREIKKHK